MLWRFSCGYSVVVHAHSFLQAFKWTPSLLFYILNTSTVYYYLICGICFVFTLQWVLYRAWRIYWTIGTSISLQRAEKLSLSSMIRITTRGCSRLEMYSMFPAVLPLWYSGIRYLWFNHSLSLRIRACALRFACGCRSLTSCPRYDS